MSHGATDDRLLGQLIAGKYQLMAIHARGAFGTVYFAHQLFNKHFVRPVALKISRQTGLTEESAGYLFSDALVLAQLMAGGHDEGKRHLVPIFDLGLLPEREGRGFLVMEYVEGMPLFAHIQGAGRVGVASGLRYLKEICRGLAVVHAQGAVHRDLKPDNILLDRAGVVRLADFGLASFTDPRLGFAPGSMGTFTYMAPETLFGRSTPAADVYAIGLLLYELFTGGGPHLQATWSSAQSQGAERQYALKQALRFAPPSEVHNEIRNDYRWLDGLILRCLELDPGRRFPDAGALLAALETCERGGDLPSIEVSDRASESDALEQRPSPTASSTLADHDERIRAARRLLARRAYDQVIDGLDIHRPAEWVALDRQGARILRLLGQAYLGRGELRAAQECLEQLRDAQGQQPLLGPQEFAAALTELERCYRGLAQEAQAVACREELRRLR